jgi:hypothetical protein
MALISSDSKIESDTNLALGIFQDIALAVDGPFQKADFLK